jgi:hypothetical protein
MLGEVKAATESDVGETPLILLEESLEKMSFNVTTPTTLESETTTTLSTLYRLINSIATGIF